MSIMLGFLCIAQNRALGSPATLYAGIFEQPSCSHTWFLTSIMLGSLCPTQKRPLRSPVTLHVGLLVQPSCSHVDHRRLFVFRAEPGSAFTGMIVHRYFRTTVVLARRVDDVDHVGLFMSDAETASAFTGVVVHHRP
jgi:hypothetical protein